MASYISEISQPLLFKAEEERTKVDTPFYIEGAPRFANERNIPIPIGCLRHIGKLDKNNFGKACSIINQITLTECYPSGYSRENHNGTHSARQARVMEIWLEIMKQGKGNEIVNALSEEEKMHLQLGSYLLRAGRVDESDHRGENPDDYYTRSAIIYEAYAQQLTASKDTIDWVKKLIINSCKPVGVRDPAIDADPKSLFAWDALLTAHELDLVRCYSASQINGNNKPSVLHTLLNYFPEEQSRQLVEPLFTFAMKLCAATGCYRKYDEFPKNTPVFSLCSKDGAKCWEIVSLIPFQG